jgi:hypothetical protein
VEKGLTGHSQVRTEMPAYASLMLGVTLLEPDLSLNDAVSPREQTVSPVKRWVLSNSMPCQAVVT